MKRRTVLSIVTLTLLFAAAATAQTYVPLYTYPETDNNSTGITWPTLFSQGRDGELYSTIETNGTYNSGSVYKMSTTGEYALVYSFCSEGGSCTTTGTTPYGGVTLGPTAICTEPLWAAGLVIRGWGLFSRSRPRESGQSCGILPLARPATGIPAFSMKAPPFTRLSRL